MVNLPSPHECEILIVISRKRVRSQSDLTSDLGFSVNTIKGCLRSLKDKGFIKSSERFMAWTLTESGRTICGAIKKIKAAQN